MANKKNIKTIYIAVFVFMLSLLLIGLFNVKKAYASGLNEIYTIEELFDMFNIPEEKRIDPWKYGYKRLIVTANNKGGNELNFICYNNEFKENNILMRPDLDPDVYYYFDERVRIISYYNGEISKSSEAVYLNYAIGTQPFYKTLYDKEFKGRRIIYSSHNLYKSDGTLFFSATPQIPPTKLAPVTRSLTPEMTKALGEVVSLIPIGVGLVVSFLALRKALRMLLQILRQA